MEQGEKAVCFHPFKHALFCFDWVDLLAYRRTILAKGSLLADMFYRLSGSLCWILWRDFISIQKREFSLIRREVYFTVDS